jgi:hypothetical protein
VSGLFAAAPLALASAWCLGRTPETPRRADVMSARVRCCRDAQPRHTTPEDDPSVAPAVCLTRRHVAGASQNHADFRARQIPSDIIAGRDVLHGVFRLLVKHRTSASVASLPTSRFAAVTSGVMSLAAFETGIAFARDSPSRWNRSALARAVADGVQRIGSAQREARADQDGDAAPDHHASHRTGSLADRAAHKASDQEEAQR